MKILLIGFDLNGRTLEFQSILDSMSSRNNFVQHNKRHHMKALRDNFHFFL